MELDNGRTVARHSTWVKKFNPPESDDPAGGSRGDREQGETPVGDERYDVSRKWIEPGESPSIWTLRMRLKLNRARRLGLELPSGADASKFSEIRASGTIQVSPTVDSIPMRPPATGISGMPERERNVLLRSAD